MKPTLETIHIEVANVLRINGIKNDDLFSRYGDLMVGCENWSQAIKIRSMGTWRSISDVFTPNKGSDMEGYLYAVEIPFAYTGYYNTSHFENH